MSSRSSRSFCFIFFRMVRRPMVPVTPSGGRFFLVPGPLSLLLLAITPPTAQPIGRPFAWFRPRSHVTAKPFSSAAAMGPLAVMGVSAPPPSLTLRVPEVLRNEDTVVPSSPGPRDPRLNWERKPEVSGLCLGCIGSKSAKSEVRSNRDPAPSLLTSSSLVQCKDLFPRNMVQIFLILGLGRHPEPTRYRVSPFTWHLES